MATPSSYYIRYLIIYIHGDLTEQIQEPGHEVLNLLESKKKHCPSTQGLHHRRPVLHSMLPLQCGNPTYNRVFSFSCSNSLLEYFHRYGGRAITEQCPAAMLLMCVQSIVGVIIQVQASKILSDSPKMFPGLHGRHCICQVHDAHEQG